MQCVRLIRIRTVVCVHCELLECGITLSLIFDHIGRSREREALTGKSGGFSGIQRFGHAYIPMDETLARATMDLCNRPYLIWRVDFTRDKVGDVDTELFKEFFHAFAMNSGTCLHVECLYGVNSHHIAEACFKALARALRMAVSPDERLKGQAASTKGAL